MKKFLIVLLCGVLLFSFNLVIAQQQSQQGIHEAGTGITDPDTREAGQGTGQGLQDQEAASVDLYQENEQGGQESDGQLGQGSQAGSGRSVLRKSRVSNATQSMLEVAERNQGIGQQIRNITQNQVQTQEEAEEALGEAQKRSGFVKFLIGPDHGRLKTVEDRLDRHNQNLEELKELRVDIESEEDAVLFDEQIQIMEEVKQELEGELGEADSGFSLFGWMNRMFNR